jgi:hypothetical protein
MNRAERTAYYEFLRSTAPPVACPACDAEPGQPCQVISMGFARRGPRRVLNRICAPHAARVVSTTRR